MIQALIYTSAPRGLKPGSLGFCTVATTPGLPANLAERLEALSAYRQVYAPQDPLAHLNPVAFSHLKLVVAGKTYHVLSRVAAAGLDYSQRSNKIAAHLALEPGDLTAGGPAAVLAAPGVMHSHWEGDPRILSGQTLPSSGRAAGVCQEWQKLTGDAGWGGVLADAAANPKQQVTLIFKPDMDMLALLGEALAWLSPTQRWGATFCTYFTKLPTGVECRLRCVLDGSPEAAAAKPSSQHLVLNLCKPMAAAQGGGLVSAARSGQGSVGAAAMGGASPGVSPAESRQWLTADEDEPDVGQLRSSEYNLAPVTPRGAKAATQPRLEAGRSTATRPTKTARRGPSRVVLGALISMLVFLVAGIVALIVNRGLASRLLATSSANSGTSLKGEGGFKAHSGTAPAEESEAERKLKEEARLKTEQESQRVAAEKKKQQEEDDRKAEEKRLDLERADKERIAREKEEAETKKKELDRAQALVRGLPHAIKLPPLFSDVPKLFSEGSAGQEWMDLNSFQAALLYDDALFGHFNHGAHLRLKEQPQTPATKVWIVELVPRLAGGAESKPRELARVALSRSGWAFSWSGDTSSDTDVRNQLSNSVLRIDGHDATRHVRLREATLIPESAIRLRLSPDEDKLDLAYLFVEPKHLHNGTKVHFEALDVEGISPAKTSCRLGGPNRELQVTYSPEVTKSFPDRAAELGKQICFKFESGKPQILEQSISKIPIKVKPIVRYGDWGELMAIRVEPDEYFDLSLKTLDDDIIAEARKRQGEAESRKSKFEKLKNDVVSLTKKRDILVTDKKKEGWEIAAKNIELLINDINAEIQKKEKKNVADEQSIPLLKLQQEHASALKRLITTEFDKTSTAKLHFRAFITVEGVEIDVFQTKPREQPEPTTSATPKKQAA